MLKRFWGTWSESEDGECVDSREEMLLLSFGLLGFVSLEWKSASSAGSGVVRSGNDIVIQLPPPQFVLKEISLVQSVWQ